MTTVPETIAEKTLKHLFQGGLLFFVITITWSAGWHMEGDAYALGPYLPWLELVFPLAGLGLWGAFFSQWALGQLRPMHVSRWFYLLLFSGLLMVSVLFSVQPESSLGYLSLWLTASLMLSVPLKTVFEKPWFWRLYAASMFFGCGLWVYAPTLINEKILVLTLWFSVLYYWQQQGGNLKAVLLGFIVLITPLFFTQLGDLPWLLWFSFLYLWFKNYSLYRRKNIWLWSFVLVGLISYVWWGLSFNLFSLWPSLRLSEAFLQMHSWWHGVGLGQFEWAQFKATTRFVQPENIVSVLPVWQRWWYENGLLTLPLLLSLWLLSLGQNKKGVFVTLLFWGTVIFTTELWSTPNGILLAAFWFFSRETWQTNQLPELHIPWTSKTRSKRQERVSR